MSRISKNEMNFSKVDEANEFGLRVLSLAYREIDEQFWN